MLLLRRERARRRRQWAVNRRGASRRRAASGWRVGKVDGAGINLEQVRRSRAVGLRTLGQPLKSFRDRKVDFTVYSAAPWGTPISIRWGRSRCRTAIARRNSLKAKSSSARSFLRLAARRARPRHRRICRKRERRPCSRAGEETNSQDVVRNRPLWRGFNRVVDPAVEDAEDEPSMNPPTGPIWLTVKWQPMGGAPPGLPPHE